MQEDYNDFINTFFGIQLPVECIQHKEEKWTRASETYFALCVCVLCPYSCWCVYMCAASRVSNSVEKNRCQLQIITDRIRLAQARVDKIKGSKKATKVRQHRQLYVLHV